MQKCVNIIYLKAFLVQRKHRENNCHFHNLVEDVHICFADLINFTVSCWVIQPFSADPADQNVELQDQFVYLQNDDKSKINFAEDRYDIF